MTLQKAMRVRAELKKEISNLNELIHGYSHQISFKGKVPKAEEIAAKRAEKVAALDGLSYEDVVKRMFTLTDAILELNTAIEKANREGHTCFSNQNSLLLNIRSLWREKSKQKLKNLSMIMSIRMKRETTNE